MKRAPIVVSVALAAVVIGTAAVARGHRAQGAAAASVHQAVRLHVIANSNSPEDQADKLAVRSAVIDTLLPALSAAQGRAATVATLRSQLPAVRAAVHRTLARMGRDERARVALGWGTFPKKSVGTITLPAGRYYTMNVVLGKGAGQNWWCVLFPPLCITDKSVALTQNEPASALISHPSQLSSMPGGRVGESAPQLKLLFPGLFRTYWGRLQKALGMTR